MYRENEHMPSRNAENLRFAEQTPFYFYDLSVLRNTIGALKSELDKNAIRAFYSVKANANPEILDTVRRYKLGADCVSGNEIRRSLQCGFDASQIVYAGVGKRDDEIRLALLEGIHCINCESVEELKRVNEMAASCGKKASVSLRINPNIDSGTHRYITTGSAYNKFGLGDEEVRYVMHFAKEWDWLHLNGLHMHVGSQIEDMGVFGRLCRRMNDIHLYFRNAGFSFRSLNLGGGLGIDYSNPERMPDFSKYLGTIKKNLHVLPGQQVYTEPGRSVAGQCGSLITKVLYVKESFGKKYVIVDAGFTDLIRPALYQAYHKIENLSSKGTLKTYDVVGPICESTDCFGHDVELPECCRGDLLALRSAGAYGEVMASRYNLRELPGSVYAMGWLSNKAVLKDTVSVC